MSVPMSEVIAIVAGVMADPGFSSKEAPKVAARAFEIWEEVDSLVKAKNAEEAEHIKAKAKAEADAKTQDKTKTLAGVK